MATTIETLIARVQSLCPRSQEQLLKIVEALDTAEVEQGTFFEGPAGKNPLGMFAHLGLDLSNLPQDLRAARLERGPAGTSSS